MTGERRILWLDEHFGKDALAEVVGTIAENGATDKAFGAFARTPELLRHAIADAVTSGLHIDVLGVIAEGWITAEEIEAYRVTAPENVGKVAVLKLAKHSITRELRPVVTIGLGKSIRVPIDIAAALTGTFEGIALSIADGCIRSVGAGTCELSLEIMLAGKSLGGPPPKSWTLPGVYAFDPALHIP